MAETDVRSLDDTDPMPSGKHRGVPMSDVPASYLHWFWTNGGEHDRRSKVSDYIRRNINVLEKEYPDGIW